ncbi:hypothetical protein rosmuc_02532 [Roseovarius mucosus DSM 17069]|uniref:PDZ domain-containing protein n=1 Tax=Roseovarius mucosus DSM 17069 TaxID=1288298 RepID=A0A0A0HM90_9RHOB|nr:hypothetical protein [Roseovarius mucosus]KGM87794.1 hypothetical protein rosmuc_02532 [Roseovarius mucosus DSM 17069]
MSPADPSTRATALALTSVNPQGKSLGLRSGDILLRVDGQLVDGKTKDIQALFKNQPERARLMWIYRDGQVWPILGRSAILGRWRVTPKPEGITALPEHRPADRWQNFEVMIGPDESYDAQPRTPSTIALLPPLYMIQMRLWTPLILWAALMLVSIPLGWIAGAALQVLICVYFWRAAPMLVRADRTARGFRLWRVVAAKSERDLHRQMTTLAPDMRFVHAPVRSLPERVVAR